MYKKGKKIIAAMLVLIIMLANFSNVGIYASEVFASTILTENQNAKTNNSNIEFNAYFTSGEDQTYVVTKNIGEESKIIVDVTVKKSGYLKNTIIRFTDSNFELINVVDSDYISSINAETNVVELKQIDGKENIKIELPIRFKDKETVSEADFSSTSLVEFTGTYVDENGKNNNVKKQITLNLNWTANAESVLQYDISKFVPYNINEQKGLIVQTIIKSGVKDNVLPIKETKIELQVPNINNIPPKDIKVNANTTVATNGNDSTSFNEDNYTVNDNKVIIKVQNNENILWKKEGQDEYVITAIYPEDVLSTLIDSTNVDININSNIQLYNANQDILTANVQEIKTIDGQVGSIVDFAIEANEKLSKGQIYANYISNNKKEIEYTQKVIANIGLANLTNGLEIAQGEDSFIANGQEFEADIYYKSLQISKQNFDKLLGSEGRISIYSQDMLIGTIDNTNIVNEQGNLMFELSSFNIKNVTLITTKPIAEGKLEIISNKAIKTDLSYNKLTVETFENINLKAQIKAVSDDMIILDQSVKINIALIEPEIQTEIKINNKDLSTIVKNENIEIRAILKTDSIYNKLFENPKIEIELPSYIKEINIKNVQLMFEDELAIEQTNYVEENDGTKKIVILLKGIQTEYSLDTASKGANVVITADLTADNLTPTVQSQIKMTVANKKDVTEASTNINFVAPVGIVTVNKMINNTDMSEVMALTDDKIAKLEVITTSKNITSEIQVINNYQNKINNIRILGRTLMKNTTDIETGDSLNNTFDAPMLSPIDTQGMENITIYYTENGNATENLNDSSNGWTIDITDYSKVKSYLIILNNYEMGIGDKIKFSYNAQIPENLNYSETVNSLYTVYFDNIQEEQTLNDKAKSRTLTLTTGVAPTLEVSLQSNSEENSVVREQQYVKFKATIKNSGAVDAQNVKLNITAPNSKIYTYKDELGKVQFTEDISLIEDPTKQLVAEYTTKHTEYIQDNFTSEYEDSEDVEKTIEVGTLKQGETIEIEYELKIVNVEVYSKNALSENDKDLLLPETVIKNQVRVIANEMQKEVISNEYKLKVAEGLIKVSMKTDKYIDYILIKGDTLKYSARVESISNESLKNVVVKLQIPENVEVKEVVLENLVISSDYEIKYTTSIDKDRNVVIFNIEELPTDWMINCNVNTQIGDVQGKIQATATVEAENVDTHYSNPITNNVSKLSFNIKQMDPEKQYIKEAEQITYIYEIQNTSDVYTNSFKFENKIPEGMKFISAEVVKDNISYSRADQIDDVVELNLNSFKAGSKITIKVIMQAEKFENGEMEKEVTNYAMISGKDFETLTSNSIKTVIEYNKDIHKIDYGDGNISDENPNDHRFKISGLAWIDSNQNGQRDDNETLLSGVEVRLLSKRTNELVEDTITGAKKITKTLSTGEYMFTNLEEGEYLVIFVYNSAKYDLTEYKKVGVSDTTNSDVINIELVIDGKLTKVATSDTIKISNSNARNIDIGLCESEKSDLKLDKYISSITVTYGDTVKTYSYDNSKLTKVEIPTKEISKATVIIDYKIVVTNEGAIANYIRKVVDYIPKDMKFNSELNRDWYQSTNGDLYNSSLANTKLESGETAELTLTLTKKMTDTNTGIVNNNAEIYEVFNEEGILDIDSTPANKVNSEDDMSAADVVISIKTGDAIIYTVLISVIICMVIGVSAYYIRKIFLTRM